MTSDDDLAYTSAVALIESYRAGALSPVETTRMLLDRLDRVAAPAQRVLHRRPRRRIGGGAAIRRALAARRTGGAARRRAGNGQGSDADARVSDLARLASRRSRPGLVGRRAGGGPAARSRGGHPRQDDDTRIRLEGIGRQPADRHYPQPMGFVAHLGRQQRRGSGRGRGRDRAVASRQRRRRVDPHPVGVLRDFRAQTEFWPSAGLPALAARPVVASGADRANCRRRGIAARSAQPPRSPRSLCAAARRPRLARRTSTLASRAGASPTARTSAMRGSIARSPRRWPQPARQFEALGAIVEQVDRIFDSPRDALFTLWAAGLAILMRTFPDERKDRPIRVCWRPQRRARGSAPSIGSAPTSCATRSAGRWAPFTSAMICC